MPEKKKIAVCEGCQSKRKNDTDGRRQAKVECWQDTGDKKWYCSKCWEEFEGVPTKPEEGQDGANLNESKKNKASSTAPRSKRAQKVVNSSSTVSESTESDPKPTRQTQESVSRTQEEAQRREVQVGEGSSENVDTVTLSECYSRQLMELELLQCMFDESSNFEITAKSGGKVELAVLKDEFEVEGDKSEDGVWLQKRPLLGLRLQALQVAPAFKIKSSTCDDMANSPQTGKSSSSGGSTQQTSFGVYSSKDDDDDDDEDVDYDALEAAGYIDEEANFPVSLDITFPRLYPCCQPVEWLLDAPTSLLHKSEYNEVLRLVNESITGNEAFENMEQVMELVNVVKTTLENFRQEAAEEQLADHRNYYQTLREEEDFLHNLTTADLSTAATAGASSDGTQELDPATRILGRRMIYYHHIMSSMKRSCIVRWAKVLNLSGFCKIGYPGLLVVEGPEQGCEQYVKHLQRLRWKLMVVRGEEKLPLTLDNVREADSIRAKTVTGSVCHPTTTTTSGGFNRNAKKSHSTTGNSSSLTTTGSVTSLQNVTIDRLRLVPHEGVIEMIDSADIGERCKKCGLHELFLTGMKIYK